MSNLATAISRAADALKDAGNPLNQDAYEREMRIGILCAELALMGATFDVLGKEVRIALAGKSGEYSISVVGALLSWFEACRDPLAKRVGA